MCIKAIYRRIKFERIDKMFPDIFEIMIVDETTGVSIKNVAVNVTIFANHKNNYSFIPCVRDEEGMIIFSKELLKKQIEEQRNMFIMDYGFTLEDCQPKIEVEIMTSDSIKKLINAMEIYKGFFSYLNDIHTLQQMDNRKYELKSQIENFNNDKLVYIILHIMKV